MLASYSIFPQKKLSKIHNNFKHNTLNNKLPISLNVDKKCNFSNFSISLSMEYRLRVMLLFLDRIPKIAYDVLSAGNGTLSYPL